LSKPGTPNYGPRRHFVKNEKLIPLLHIYEKRIDLEVGFPDVFGKNTGLFVNSDKNLIIEKNN